MLLGWVFIYIYLAAIENKKKRENVGGGGGDSSSSNWILMSFQPHRVTSGQSDAGHKQIHISKLFSHSVKSIYKTNHFANRSESKEIDN